MAGFDHKTALGRIWDLVRRTNAYVDERAPWKLAKLADAGDVGAAPDLLAVRDRWLDDLTGVTVTKPPALFPRYEPPAP
jgi:methionyl-tRNA synthetase